MRLGIKIACVALSVGFGLAGCATTPSPSSTAKSAGAARSDNNVTATASKDNSKRLYCVEDKVTGSRVVVSRRCYTAEEKARLEEETKRAISDMTNTTPPPAKSPMQP